MDTKLTWKLGQANEQETLETYAGKTTDPDFETAKRELIIIANIITLVGLMTLNNIIYLKGQFRIIPLAAILKGFTIASAFCTVYWLSHTIGYLPKEARLRIKLILLIARATLISASLWLFINSQRYLH